MTRESFSEAKRQRSFREADAAIRRASRKAIAGLKARSKRLMKHVRSPTLGPRKTSAAKFWSGSQKSPSTLLKVNRGGLAGVPYALKKGRLLDTNMMGGTASEFLAQFALDQARVPRVKDLFIHKSISFNRALNLSEEAMKKHTQKYLKNSGFEGCQYLSILHSDTPTPHVHVIVSRIKEDGSKVSMSHNFYHWRAALRQSERESGLPEFILSEDVAQGKTDRMASTQRRAKRVDQSRNWVHKSAVIEARNASNDIHQFGEELKKRGLEMELSTRTDGTTTGLMIRKTGSDNYLPASSIDRSITLPKLEAHWSQSTPLAVPMPGKVSMKPSMPMQRSASSKPHPQPQFPRQRG